MTSSIFLPRRSQAWPEPRTHLMESTMFVLPEPFGPTMAVTPPSNWISVSRAKVLKPSNCRDLRNKLAGRLADVGDGGPQATTYKPRRRPASAGKRGFQWNGATTGTRGIERYEGQPALLDRLSELAAPRRLGHRVQRHDLCRRGLRGCRRRRRRLPLLPRRAARAGRLRGLGRRELGRCGAQALQGGARGVLLRLLLAGAVAGAQRLRPREDDRRVLAAVAHARALAVVHRRFPEPLLSDLLQASFEVLVAHRRRQRPVAVQVVVIGRVVTGIEEHRSEHSLKPVREEGFQAAASPLGDTLAEVEVAAEVELLRELGQGIGVDHGRARLRELALCRTRVMLVEVLGGDQLENGVAQVFEPLVVAGRHRGVLIRERAVRHSLEQQPRVTKVNPDLLLEELQRLGERCGASPRVLC